MSLKDNSDLLLPRPQQCEVKPQRVRLPARPRITCQGSEAEAAGRWLALALAPWSSGPASDGVDVTLRVDASDPAAGEAPQAVRGQGYRLQALPGGVTLTGFGEAGLFHGAATLAQWARLHRRPADLGEASVEVPAARIIDWPDFASRGVMLDISRDKVPTMDTLMELVDLLASLKINQLQLYMEHTFAYTGHETVWREASPLTGQQVRMLDFRCRERGVELVPNQNSLGHFHRWLKHEPYRRLAECPEGIEHPFCREREPFSLCPVDPGALKLLEDLYDQLLPNFHSPLFNVGLDETMDVGTGRSAAACEERGTVEVYLEYLIQVHELARRRGRRMQFWGDIILKRPDLIERLPDDVIALEWGYEASHPFEKHTPHFARSGLDFYVCPGTSSWNSLGGRVDNALKNLARAAAVGHEQGAAGYLITDWGDFGHLQPLPVSYPGILAGAGFCWNADTAQRPEALPLSRLLDAHVPDLRGGGGEALVQIGDAYLRTGTAPTNGTVLFYLLRFPDGSLGHRRLRGLNAEGLARAAEQVEDAAAGVAEHLGMDARVRQELSWVCGLLRFCARLGLARLETGATGSSAELPTDRRRALCAELEPLITQHEPVWLGRNRAGGRNHSVTWLTRVLDLLA